MRRAFVLLEREAQCPVLSTEAEHASKGCSDILGRPSSTPSSSRTLRLSYRRTSAIPPFARLRSPRTTLSISCYPCHLFRIFHYGRAADEDFGCEVVWEGCSGCPCGLHEGSLAQAGGEERSGRAYPSKIVSCYHHLGHRPSCCAPPATAVLGCSLCCPEVTRFSFLNPQKSQLRRRAYQLHHHGS